MQSLNSDDSSSQDTFHSLICEVDLGRSAFLPRRVVFVQVRLEEVNERTECDGRMAMTGVIQKVPGNRPAPRLQDSDESAGLDMPRDESLGHAGEAATPERGLEYHVHIVDREGPFDGNIDWPVRPIERPAVEGARSGPAIVDASVIFEVTWRLRRLSLCEVQGCAHDGQRKLRR